MLNTARASENTTQESLDKSFPADFGSEKTAKVLLIEDDRSTRRLVSASLKGQCEIVEAADASNGITAYNALQPDIVFMDIELPDGNGYDLMRWMLRNDPGAFVVMFSGHSNTDNVMRSINKGAKGFISKPFDPAKMLHFIKQCPKLD